MGSNRWFHFQWRFKDSAVNWKQQYHYPSLTVKN
jgi:hypothetical protein